MKCLIGTILVSLVVIAVVAATPAPAQNFLSQNFQQGFQGQGFQGQGFQGQGFQGQGFQQPAGFSSVEIAAEQFHDAVTHFQEEAIATRRIDRFTLRLIDRFEHQASDLCRIAGRSDDFSRLLFQINEIGSLQPRVESAVFGGGCPIVRAALAECWNEVLVAYTVLSTEMQRLQIPAYESGFGSRPGCGPAVFPAPQISFRNPPIDPRLSGFDPRQRGFDPRGGGFRGAAPVQRVAPFGQPQRRNSNDLRSLIIGGILSRVVQGL